MGRYLCAVLALLILAAVPARAAVEDAVLNKEGFWASDVDNGVCAASMTLQGGTIFLLRGDQGQVTFGLFSAKGPIRKGKAGRIQTEAYGFDFEPSYGKGAETLYYAGDFDARALAALRLARQAQVLIDGRPVASMTLEGTGFEGALDGVIACSKGEAGWWGKGVQAAGAEAADAPPTNKEGVWSLEAGKGACVAHAMVGEDRQFQLLVAGSRIALAVGAVGDGKLPRGRRGKAETDSYVFDFKPQFDDDDLYMATAEAIDSQSLFTLRRAKWIRLKVDGRVLVDAGLEGSGFPELIDAALACAAGEKGWWGEGARAP
ncbi:hypothetical protein [uncultured Phenylobacterium sp.]|uniref:hypothetical protein n=1 Tax=uncultured Phenylobacterium sp. TaxID=349273 RepID=UPI0025FAE66D|nr:hypothetical protein [uncultured Phenylobacterium sp.]